MCIGTSEVAKLPMNDSIPVVPHNINKIISEFIAACFAEELVESTTSQLPAFLDLFTGWTRSLQAKSRPFNPSASLLLLFGFLNGYFCISRDFTMQMATNLSEGAVSLLVGSPARDPILSRDLFHSDTNYFHLCSIASDDPIHSL